MFVSCALLCALETTAINEILADGVPVYDCMAV